MMPQQGLEGAEAIVVMIYMHIDSSCCVRLLIHFTHSWRHTIFLRTQAVESECGIQNLKTLHVLEQN